MCIWTFYIVTDYTNTTFRKHTAFVFRSTTNLKIRYNLKELTNYKFIRERQNNPTS
jgi:hypothetical protein